MNTLQYLIDNIKTLDKISIGFTDLLTLTTLEGESMKSNKSLEGRRLYAIQLDNCRHLKESLESIKTAIAHIELIRTDNYMGTSHSVPRIEGGTRG